MGDYYAHFTFNTLQDFSCIGAFLFLVSVSNDKPHHFEPAWPKVCARSVRHIFYRCRSPPSSVLICLDPKIETEEYKMVKINLRKYYPDFYTADCIVEVPDEVAALMDSCEHAEAAYYLRRYRHKAYYSLDRGDGIEHDILFVSLSPCEIYERKVTVEQLHAAIAALPDKQAKRIYAYYFLGMSKSAIAKTEHVNECTVRESITSGLRNMEKYLKHFA